ncbi:MAG: NAD(P)H-quinone oxidoreductase subunit 3 [Crenarchaeota archaeon]|nr:NAD(P)H-quinone oxidoreductase subunit 3 [Thermoproteota archaeon]
MIIESVIAFVLIICASSMIYLLGRRVAPKTTQTEAERDVYACGEKISYPKLRVNVSLYKYLIYFVILDSSVLLLAFTSFRGAINVPLILIYLSVILVSGFLLVDGVNDE